VVKAVGEGLSYPLDGFEVSLDASCSAQDLAVGGLEWRVVSLAVDIPYAAALAAAAGDWRIERWDAAVDA
jgi:phosphopantetheinyl transferase